MQTSLWGGVLLVAVQTLGCSDSVEDNCKTLCDWADDCGDEEIPASCSEECIENMKDADAQCRDALDDFADCVEINECEDGECGGEAAELLGDCPVFF
jgi:hypothetical protein